MLTCPLCGCIGRLSANLRNLPKAVRCSGCKEKFTPSIDQVSDSDFDLPAPPSGRPWVAPSDSGLGLSTGPGGRERPIVVDIEVPQSTRYRNRRRPTPDPWFYRFLRTWGRVAFGIGIALGVLAFLSWTAQSAHVPPGHTAAGDQRWSRALTADVLTWLGMTRPSRRPSSCG